MTPSVTPAPRGRPTTVAPILLLLMSSLGVAALAPGAAAGDPDGSGAGPDAIAVLIASILEDNATKACTSQSGACRFACAPGDTLYVAASGGLWVSASATCGGRAARCSAFWGICNGESEDIVRVDDPDGVCKGSQLSGRPTVSCAAAPADAAL